MKNKNGISKRTFVPKKIGDTIKNFTEEFSNRYGKEEYLILTKWPQIVGSFFVNHSEPEKITQIPGSENEIGEIFYLKSLHVNVSPAAALEFQHFKNKILEKINSYFGYKAISEIRLKQNFIPRNNIKTFRKNVNKNIFNNNKKIINKVIKNLNKEDLKKSLEKLEQSINKKNDEY